MASLALIELLPLTSELRAVVDAGGASLSLTSLPRAVVDAFAVLLTAATQPQAVIDASLSLLSSMVSLVSRDAKSMEPLSTGSWSCSSALAWGVVSFAALLIALVIVVCQGQGDFMERKEDLE
jgi:hypothetical protein